MSILGHLNSSLLYTQFSAEQLLMQIHQNRRKLSKSSEELCGICAACGTKRILTSMNNRNTLPCAPKAGGAEGTAWVEEGKRCQARTAHLRPCSSWPAAVSDPPQAFLVHASATRREKHMTVNGDHIPFSCMANVCKILQSEKKLGSCGSCSLS